MNWKVIVNNALRATGWALAGAGTMLIVIPFLGGTWPIGSQWIDGVPVNPSSIFMGWERADSIFSAIALTVIAIMIVRGVRLIRKDR